MQCPKCQFENVDGAKFCNECGYKLEISCSECNKINPPGSKFCNECGQTLTTPQEPVLKDLSFEEKIDKIQRYLPKGLTEKILSQKDRIEGERKQVTVMFCDLKGFTSLSEKLGPEEAYNLMDQVYEILIHKVHDYEGTVNELTGDGIMALFGAPIALEDAPQRAIRSAYAIHRAMTEFSNKIRQSRLDLQPLKMRIGIHSGPVVVGTLGNDLRVEFKAVGETVNLASRMEGLAEPGTTYVTKTTFKLTEGFFRFEALGNKRVKGIEALVSAYQVIAPSARRTRFDVSAERGLTPFVGRARELELLIDGFMRSRKGRGQAFSIISEAGVGKSRLLYEFRKAVANEDVTFLEGKCLSYSRGVAYHPLIDILKSNYAIRRNDTDSEIRNKASEGLKDLGLDEANTLPYFLELLSVKDSGIEKIAMSPGARKDRTVEAFKRIVLKGSEIRPLIMAIEDLHWIDKSSEETLEELLGSISGAKVLLIFTYRPEFMHAWGARSYHSQVNLNRLSNRESISMLEHILGATDIQEDLEDLVLEKTEGIPFFIEEFIRSLNDLKLIEKKDNTCFLSKEVRQLTIPSTIQDVIMARVDSLPEVTKEVLQTGSVIEREFSYQLIKRVTGLPDHELAHHLSGLKDVELLYERGIYPQSTYIFKHALTREVVYNSILIKNKKQLHELVGNHIEDLYNENIIEHYGVLAEHFIKSESHEKGASYSKLAAKRDQKAASYNDAINYGQKRVDCLEKLPKSEDIKNELIDARVTLGLYYNQMTHLVKANEAVSPIVELASKPKFNRRISQIKSILGTHAFGVEGNYSKSIQFLQDALKIAQKTNDVVSLWISNHWLGHAFAETCEFDKALNHLNQALEISKAANLTWSISIMKSCIAHTVFNTQGKAEKGYQTSLEGVNLAEESGDPMSKAEAYVHHGISCYLRGFFDDAEMHLHTGERYCKKIDYVSSFLASYYLGLIYIEKRQFREAQDFLNNSISLLENRGIFDSFKKLNKITFEFSKVMQEDRNVNIEPLYKYASDNKTKAIDGPIALSISQLLLNTDKPNIQKSEEWLQKAIRADKKNEQNWNLAKDYAFYTELLIRKNEKIKAKEKLRSAIGLFKGCGADGWVKKYEKELTDF